MLLKFCEPNDQPPSIHYVFQEFLRLDTPSPEFVFACLQKRTRDPQGIIIAQSGHIRITSALCAYYAEEQPIWDMMCASEWRRHGGRRWHETEDKTARGQHQ